MSDKTDIGGDWPGWLESYLAKQRRGFVRAAGTDVGAPDWTGSFVVSSGVGLPDYWAAPNKVWEFHPANDADTERTRILAWLDTMKPGEVPYSKGAWEIERKAQLALWQRMRDAIEGGNAAPTGEDKP